MSEKITSNDVKGEMLYALYKGKKQFSVPWCILKG